MVSTPRSAALPLPSPACSTTAPAPSPNSTQVPRSFQSRMREKVSAPMTSAVRAWPTLMKLSATARAIDEAAADRLHVEGGAPAHAEARLDLGRRRREGMVGRRGGEHDQVDGVGADSGMGEGGLGRGGGEIGGRLAVGRDMALADAGALGDPFVGGLEAAGQLGIGHHLLRQISAAADHLGTHDHQRATTCGLDSVPAAKLAKSSRIFSRDFCVIMSTATPMALAKPSASVPPWLFTATPLRPRKMAPL